MEKEFQKGNGFVSCFPPRRPASIAPRATSTREPGLPPNTACTLPPRDRASAACPRRAQPVHARSRCRAWPSASHHPVPSQPIPVSCLEKDPPPPALVALHSIHAVDLLSAPVSLPSLPLFSSQRVPWTARLTSFPQYAQVPWHH
jgi:hypothetical protein